MRITDKKLSRILRESINEVVYEDGWMYDKAQGYKKSKQFGNPSYSSKYDEDYTDDFNVQNESNPLPINPDIAIVKMIPSRGLYFKNNRSVSAYKNYFKDGVVYNFETGEWEKWDRDDHENEHYLWQYLKMAPKSPKEDDEIKNIANIIADKLKQHGNNYAEGTQAGYDNSLSNKFYIDNITHWIEYAKENLDTENEKSALYIGMRKIIELYDRNKESDSKNANNIKAIKDAANSYGDPNCYLA